MSEQIGLDATHKASCPYYGGLVKDGKSTLIKCGENHQLLHQHPDKDPATLFRNDKCLGITGSDPYNCRAFLMQSIQDKKINVGSDLCIPELQEIYDIVKDRPGCGGCEHYWWSAGYRHIDSDGNRLPCDAMTHYCRPDFGKLYKITEDNLRFCIRRPPQHESEDNNMQENMTMTATMDITPEYQQAVDLHHRIVADAEAAASALISLAQNLKRMRDDKLFVQLGYENFEDYTEKAVGLKRRQAYNYISALEKLPTHLLQSNAHLGITKLELLAQVPALDREGFLEENDVEGISVREMEELVKKVKEQGEQLSMLGAENKELKQANEQLNEEKEQLENVSFRESELENSLHVARERIAELEAAKKKLEDRPVEVAVQEPDEETLAKIREEARAAAEADTAAKIKEAEQAAKEKAEKAADKKIQSARDEAAREAEERFKSSLAAVESEKAEALSRADELARQLKASGNSDTVALSLYFGEINKYFDLIAGLVDKNRADNPEVAENYKGGLVKALNLLLKNAKEI